MNDFFKFELPVERILLCMGIDTTSTFNVVHKDRWAHGLLFNTKHPRTYYFEGYGAYEVGIGDILYFPKHTDYHGRVEPGCYCDVINFDFFVDVTFAPFVMTPKNPSAVEEIFKSAERAFARGGAEKIKCMAKLYELFALIAKENEAKYLPSDKAALIEPALKHINESFCERMPSVRELADMCGVSEGYFRAIFTSQTGQSPIDYATTLKINRAKELIRSGLCPISEAAASVGFEDIAYFSRVFKKQIGISPREYKNSSV